MGRDAQRASALDGHRFVAAKVPGCRFVCLTSVGESGHMSHKVLRARSTRPDRRRVS